MQSASISSDPARLPQLTLKGPRAELSLRIALRIHHDDGDPARLLRLLRTRQEWTGRSRGCKHKDEFAPPQEPLMLLRRNCITVERLSDDAGDGPLARSPDVSVSPDGSGLADIRQPPLGAWSGIELCLKTNIATNS
jgi:hypothetical protein